MSGGDKHLLECGMRLKAKGVDIDFMIPDDAEFEDYPSKLNLIHYDNPKKKGKDCKNFLEISYLYWQRKNAIIKYMKQHKEDMNKYTHVIISGPFLYDMDPGIYLKKNINTNCKLIIYWHHTTKPSSGLRYRLAKLQEWNAMRQVKKYVDMIITSNIIEQGRLIEKLDKLTGITSHGVDWEIIDTSYKTRKEEHSACFMGRLEKSKGVWDLITVWERIVYHESRKYEDAILHIIGKGVEEEEMKKTIEHMGLKDNIVFHGHVSDEEKYRILLDSNVFLFPSQQEGFGVVLAEALACGCDTIAYDLDHYESIFENNIKYIHQGAWQDIADQTVKSFNFPYDFEKINAQSSWARSKFNWNQVAIDNYNMWIYDKPKSL
jgi:glycosyltransferase involved in cell wall biosynthesis